MNKGFIPLGGLALGLLLSATLTTSEAQAEGGIRLNFERYSAVWGGQSWLFHQARPHASGQVAFTIDAPPLTGLYPGATRAMKFTVTNTGNSDLRIDHLSGGLRGTTNPACAPSPSNLVVGPWQRPPASPIVVPAHHKRTVGTLPLYMPNTVDNSCQRVRFTIRLDGTGSTVKR
jgi:hypothetical protein